jgi:hypothetical protein
MLDVFTHYLLVLCSLTGLSTLCGQTKWLMACEENQTILLSSNTNKPLKSNVFPDLQVVEPRVLEYVVGAAANNLEDAANNPEDNNNSILVLKRRFEYEFEFK